MTKKDPAAVALVKKRWAKTTAEERTEIARHAGKGRLKTMTKKERKESARKAAQARWGKKEEK